MQNLGIFLVGFSLFCEFFLLFISFYLKENKLFFIALTLLIFRGLYLFAPLLQAHFFSSLFLPFVFTIFALLPASKKVFEKSNIGKFIFLFLIFILGIILSKNTNFNASLSSSNFSLFFFDPISKLSFYCFVFEALLLSALSLLKNKFIILIAFILAFVQFLFTKTLLFSYFEFASVFLLFYLLWQNYKNLYYDEDTRLPNLRALKRYLKGHDYELLSLNISSQNELLNPVNLSKILEKLELNAKIFYINQCFILVCNNASKLAEQLKAYFDNSQFKDDFSFELKSTNLNKL